MTNDDIFIMGALKLINVPYKYGGNNPLDGLDCSGLAVWLLNKQGRLPYGFDASSAGLYAYFLKLGNKQLKEGAFGALAYYGSGLDKISHVAYVLSDKYIIEAGGGDSKVTDLATAKARGAVVRLNTIRYRKDFLSILDTSVIA